jgi:hypothetical protein
MFTSYLKMAWRNLMKHKFISFINLFGLTVGLTCCLLITAYIIHETSYDKYNANASRIYRITRSFNNRERRVSLRLKHDCAAVRAIDQIPFPGYPENDAPAAQWENACSLRRKNVQ